MTYKTNMDEIEKEIFSEHGIEVVGENKYRIIGKSYTIRFCGRTDDGHGRLWDCDCPAGLHGRDCKHIAAVVAANNEFCNATGMD